MNYVYIKYETDLLRIQKPSTTVYKLEGEDLEKPFLDQETGTGYAFRPDVGLGWLKTEKNGEVTFILDQKGVRVELKDAPKDGWIKSAVFSEGTNKFREDKIQHYFRKQMKVKTILEGELKKYQNLLIYFGELTVEDIENFSEEELLDGVKDEHRLQMRSFFRNEFSKLGQRPVTVIPPSDPAPAQLSVSPQKRIVLDLRQKVVSTQMAAVSPSRIPAAKLVENVESTNLNRKFVVDINLASCNLGDEDLVHVEKLLQYFERCPRLDLSGNRFHGGNKAEVDQILHKMLDPAVYQNLEFVDIVRNPIASIDRKDFIESLKADALKRLIWIPASFLENGAWKQMVSPDLHEIVVDTHKKYYYGLSTSQ